MRADPDQPAMPSIMKCGVLVAALVSGGGCAAVPPPPAAHAGAATRIDGSTAVMPLASALADAWGRTTGAAPVTLGSGLGSAARLDALAQGRIDIALASHGIVPADMAAHGLVAHEVARAAVVFAVHETVAVASLTQQQVCAMYAGTLPSWHPVGALDRAVVPLARPAGEVDADVVLAGIPCFAAAAASGHARLVSRPETMATLIASTPGAIGVTSMPFVERSAGAMRAVVLDGVAADTANVRSGRYPLVRPSYLVTRADPSPAVRAFLAFVRSDAGARTISASGAVPIR